MYLYYVCTSSALEALVTKTNSLFVCTYLTMKLILIIVLIHSQIVSYLLDLPEKDEEEEERAQINSFDTLWGETGRTPPDKLYCVFM